jgi:uncharacterized membrane protein (UPF0127 family)
VKYAAILLVLGMVLGIFTLAGCSGEQQNSDTPDSEESTSSSGAPTRTESAAGEELRTVTIDASSGEEVTVRVEIADDSAEQAQGLMNRTSLGENRGMLFVFEEEATLSFWMRNTLIPLSVAYIDSEGRIVDIQKMEPLDDEPPQYVSAEPAQYALEVNQDFFEERGVKVGDTTELPV